MKKPTTAPRGKKVTATKETAEEVSKAVVAIGIRMSPEQHKDLKAIAYRTSVSLNSLLIEGVERVIADRKAKGVRFD